MTCCLKKGDDVEASYLYAVLRKLGCAPGPREDEREGDDDDGSPNETNLTPRSEKILELQYSSSDHVVTYRPNEQLISGGDKYLYSGHYNGQCCAIAIGKKGHEFRLASEIEWFKKIGKHPNIVNMFYSGKDYYTKAPVMVVEVIEPIGYDLSRLINQYSWTGQATLPSSLMRHLVQQLISALQHMHARQLIHRDLKTRNLLVTQDNVLKLIDMGIVCKIGDKGELRNEYMAPEVCLGQVQSAKVDCWGVGLVLHQTYQRITDLLETEGKVRMRAGIPAEIYHMPERVNEAMNKLLEFDPDERWSLQDILESRWFHAQAPVTPFENDEVHAPMLRSYTSEGLRLYLKKYISRNFVSGYGAHITAMQQHIIGKKLMELDFSKHGAVVLLIRYSDGTFERVPSARTEICAGSWIYFGLPPMKEGHVPALTAICQILFRRKFEPQARDLRESGGNLVPFVPEFDSFEFPDREEYGSIHRNYVYVLGAVAEHKYQIALDMRRTENINICGIVHMPQKDRQQRRTRSLSFARAWSGGRDEETEEWFPGADAEVYPGDLGLVMRAPLGNGLSQPTTRDVDLQRLMAPDEPLPTTSFQEETPCSDYSPVNEIFKSYKSVRHCGEEKRGLTV